MSVLLFFTKGQKHWTVLGESHQKSKIQSNHVYHSTTLIENSSATSKTGELLGNAVLKKAKATFEMTVVHFFFLLSCWRPQTIFSPTKLSKVSVDEICCGRNQ